MPSPVIHWIESEMNAQVQKELINTDDGSVLTIPTYMWREISSANRNRRSLSGKSCKSKGKNIMLVMKFLFWVLELLQDQFLWCCCLWFLDQMRVLLQMPAFRFHFCFLQKLRLSKIFSYSTSGRKWLLNILFLHISWTKMHRKCDVLS